MKLHRRIPRNVKNNTSFYVSSALLTLFAVYITILMYSAIDMIDVDFTSLMNKCNIEDAQFNTLVEIPDKDIESIEDEFDVLIEKTKYVDIDNDEYTLRMFRPTSKINLYEVIEGNDVSSERDILLNPDFMSAHNLGIGDSIDIDGTSYNITGSCVRPDYLYAQKEATDFYVDDTTFGQVTMTADAFDKLDHIQSYYTITYNKDNKDNEYSLRKYLYENYQAISYLSADANNRISIARDMIKEYILIVDSIAPCLFLMISVIVAIVLARMVKHDQKRIGTLMALGYRKREIAFHYSLYALLPSLIGSILGIMLSIATLKPACLLFATDFETIDYHIVLSAKSIIISLLMPAVFYMLTAVFVVLNLLRNNTVLLLNGNVGNEHSKSRHILTKSHMKFKFKFHIRNLLINYSRSLVVIFGLICGGCTCVFGFIFMDSCKELVDTGINDIGNFEYQYYLNTIDNNAPDEGETMLNITYEVPGSRSLITLSGVNKESEYLSLETKSGKPIEYGKYYISSNASARYGINPGDEFTFANVLTLEEYKVTISDIILDNTQNILYTSKENAAKYIGLDDNSYNVVISNTEINSIDDNIIATVISKDSMRAQIERAVEIIYGMVYAMIFFGCIICIITIYLIVNMLIEENKINITTLKVLGYRKKEINSLILNTNHLLVPISYLLSVWICLALCKLMFAAFVEELNLYINPIISIPSMIICFIVIVISYLISLAMLKKKIYKIDICEQKV